MALAYLLDPNLQIQNEAGVNNVAGFIRVFMNGTDDRAVTYSDFTGTLNPADIPLDNNGRCVIIADSERVYRVEVYNRNGGLCWTQYPLTTMAGGGGTAPVVELESSDGSIGITRTGSGGKVTYDLSAASDDPNFTEWAKCSGANTPSPGIMIPLKADGNMDVTADGITLKADNLYHITARFAATKTETSPYYDKITVAFNTSDGEQTHTEVSSGRIVDYSMGLEQEFEISADIKVGARGVSLYFSYAGQDVSGGSIRFRTADIHMLNSGVPHIPGGMASREWVSENYQEKLTAGEGITIEDNVISADASQQVQSDWAEANTSSPAYIKNKPDMDSYATDQELTSGLATKQDVIQDIADIRAGAQRGATAVQPSDLAAVATSGSYNDLSNKPSIPAAQVQSDWNQSNSAAVDFIKNKPSIPVVPPMKDLVAGSNVTITEGVDAVTISASGSPQVQADWAQSDSSAVDYIKNKPNLATVATSGSYNDLSNKPSIPAAQVQSDWNEADSTQVDYIKNKPDLSGFATQAELTQGLAGKQDTISDLATIRAGSADGATAVQPGDLATVATSGSYTDLSDKPSIPAAQVQSDWGEADSGAVDYIKNKPNLATVATSGDYNDLTNKPSIPAAPVQSDWNETDSSSLAYIQNKPTIPSVPVQDVTVNGSSVVSAGVAAVTVPTKTSDLTNDSGFITASDIPAQQQSDWNESDSTKPDYIKNKPSLAAVATTGAYSDLSGTPSIPTATSDLTNDSGFITASDIPAQQQSDWTEADTSDPSYIQNKPNLATVATTGDYSDLSNTPTIPAAQVNSDWNASSGISQILNKPSLATVATSGSYADLSNTPAIPTATSDLTNDSGFITASDIPAQAQADWTETNSADPSYIQNKPSLAAVATSGSYADLSNTPTIPTATSDLNNDSGFITLSDVPAQVNADWNSSSGASEILNKPTIPSGAQLVPAATSADADKVLTVDAQGIPEWAVVPSQATGLFEAVYGTTTLADILQAISDKKIVYCRTSPGMMQPLDLTRMAHLADYTSTKAKFQYFEPAAAGGGELLVFAVTSSGWTSTTLAAQVKSDWAQRNSTAADFIKNKPTLAAVATSGDYADLSNTPTIPAAQVQSNWTESDTSSKAYIQNKPTLATVATSGSYTDLSNTPTIPAAQVQSDWTESDTSSKAYIQNKPSLATVATSGSYSDLSGTPTIPTVDQTYDGASTNAQSGVAVASALSGKQDTLTAGDGIDIANDVIKWLTSAGITDIQSVQALPANPDQHTLYLTPDASAQETVLYSGMKSIGDDGAATYTLTESPLNFEYIKVYYCANDNVSTTDWGSGGNKGVASVEWDTQVYRAVNTYLYVQMNGATGTSFTLHSVAANLSGIRTTTWTVQGSLNAGTSNAKWFHIYKIVGRNRIANN